MPASSRLVLLAAALGAAPVLPAQQLVVGVDHRVELLSIVFRLAGAPEYVNNDLAAYAAAVDRHFAGAREHPAVVRARALRSTAGVSHDAVMMMAIHLGELPALEERVPFDAPGLALHQRWTPEQAREFATLLRAFVRDTDVPGFLASQRTLHDSASARLRAMVTEAIDPAWFDAFFGARAGERFVLVPGLLNGGGSFGPKVAPSEGPQELWAIIGTWTTDSTGLPIFPASRAYTIAHEFAHSFVNPMVERHRARFEGFAAGCPAVADVMAAQAYQCWKTVVDESIVRATSIAWARATLTPEEALQAERREVGRGFYWAVELADSLERWRARRDAGASWEDEVPSLGRWFTALAERIPAMREAFEASRPRVVGTSVEAAGAALAPGRSTLVVTFDRPMVRGWSLQALSGPEATSVPRFSAPRITPDSLRFEIEMELAPDTAYGFMLNGPLGGGFQSSAGVPLGPTPIRFRTTAATR